MAGEDGSLEAELDAALAASRVFVGAVDASLDGTERLVTLKQFRAVATLATYGPMNSAALAERLEVHPSNATRICDRLVEAGLVVRQPSADDRRSLVLSASPEGTALVRGVMRRRRAALRRILLGIPQDELAGVTRSLELVAAAGGEPVVYRTFDTSGT